MPWIGSTFTRTNGSYSGATVWTQDAAAGVQIVTSNHDTHDQDLATGINACVNKNGANAATADLPMGGFKHTNVANAVARNQYATLGQVQDASGAYGGTSTGSSNAYVINLTPSISALVDGMELAFVANFTNTGAATLNVNSTGAVALRYSNDAALAANAILSGCLVNIRYSASSNTWRLIGLTAGTIPITGAIINGSATLTLPSTTDTLVGRATTDTLTNKTLTAPTINNPAVTSPTISGGATLNGSSSGATVLQPAAAASGTLTLPAATDTLVGRATSDTLSNKILASPTVNTPTVAGGATFNGASSGATILQAAAAASGALTLPAATDTLVGRATSDNLSNKTLVSPTIQTPTMAGTVLTQATAIASTSGTAIDFTGIPSWAKKIIVLLSGVSHNGSSNIIVQLGTGGGPTFTTSGYLSGVVALTNANGTTGFIIAVANSASTISGIVEISNLTGNLWVSKSAVGYSDAAGGSAGGGTVSLGAALTAIRITTVGGTAVFDAGTVNVMWE